MNCVGFFQAPEKTSKQIPKAQSFACHFREEMTCLLLAASSGALDALPLEQVDPMVAAHGEIPTVSNGRFKVGWLVTSPEI